MASLIAQSPLDSLLPLKAGSTTLTAVEVGAITSVSARPGGVRTVSASLKSVCGMTFPAPNRATGKDAGRCVWIGPETALLLGPVPGPIKGATITDQTDGWVVMRLSGEAGEPVLARLIPVDLGGQVFKRGHSARTILGHVPVSVTRTGASVFDLMVYRSMASTAVHDLRVAMTTIAALQA